MRENALTSKTDLVENIRTIGNQLQKREAKSRCLDTLMNLMYLIPIGYHVERRMKRTLHPSILSERWILPLTNDSERV